MFFTPVSARSTRRRHAARALLLSAAGALLGACGGGGGSDSSAGAATSWVETTLSCAGSEQLDAGSGWRLVNNTWNSAGAGTFAWSQCLKRRSAGTVQQYGWSWTWPSNGTQVFAYPEALIGAKPWEPGPGTDARFPRRVDTISRMPVSFDVETTATGNHNLAVSLWFTSNGSAPAEPDLGAIRTEIMIWADYTAAMRSNDGSTTKLGEVSVDGRVFEVFYGANWDGNAGTGITWDFIAYLAKAPATAMSFDIKRFLDDAAARGLLSRTDYLASFELGNEVVSGSGSTWVKSLSLGLE